MKLAYIWQMLFEHFRLLTLCQSEHFGNNIKYIGLESNNTLPTPLLPPPTHTQKEMSKETHSLEIILDIY